MTKTQTKYVLNSGSIRNYPEREKEYCAEIVKGLGSTPTILYVFFASPREDWARKYPEYTERFAKAVPENVTPTFELAFPDSFEEQVKRADVIFIPGGDDHLLQYWLKQFRIPGAWAGKVVAASSASSHALSQSYWTCDWRECHDGLGVVPIKFLAHFGSGFGSDDPRGPIDWETAQKELEAYGDQAFPIYALEEGRFVVIETDQSFTITGARP